MDAHESERSLRGMIFDIQRMSIHDGPGIRTTVFLKGCPLHCAWCHNPEGMRAQPELAFTPSLCIGCGYCFRECERGGHAMVDGRHHLEREQCVACFDCAEECYSGALETVGREISVAEVIDEVKKDRIFYNESGGGVTLSGGEPLAQPAFTRAILEAAAREGIHTCVETSGFGPREPIEAIVPYTRLFLFDYKETSPERHIQSTGCSNETILANLRYLDSCGAAIILRCPIVPGVNLRDDHLEGIAAIARSLDHCEAIHLMGYHALGEAKRARFGSGETGEVAHGMTREEVEAVAEHVRALGGQNVLAL